MHETHTFYELAATLIPILLLGGILAERLRPPDRDSLRARHAWVPVGLTLLLSLAVMAEVAAISAAVVGGSGFIAAIVVAAIVVGLLAVACAIVWPWLALWPYRWLAVVSGLVVVIVTFVANFGTLKQAVEAAETDFGAKTEDLNLSEAGARHYMNATIAYHSALLRAQADGRLSAAECGLLDLLDQRVQFEFALLTPGLEHPGLSLERTHCPNRRSDSGG